MGAGVGVSSGQEKAENTARAAAVQLPARRRKDTRGAAVRQAFLAPKPVNPTGGLESRAQMKLLIDPSVHS